LVYFLIKGVLYTVEKKKTLQGSLED